MPDKPAEEVQFSNDMDYPEVAALFEICGLDPEYPRDFCKSNYPDWINEDIGLEVTTSISNEAFQKLRVLLSGAKTLEEMTRVSYEYDTFVFCRMESGEFAGKEFCYSLRDRMISVPGKTPAFYYDNLPEKQRKDFGSAIPLFYRDSNELDDPSKPYSMALEALKIKLGKLQTYQERKYNHLAVVSGGFAGEQFPDMFLEMYIEENEKWGRKFDKLFLSTFEDLFVFDLVSGKQEYLPKKLGAFDLYRENIHDPPVPKGYLFKDVVKTVPDLTNPNPRKKYPECLNQVPSDDESDPGCLR